MIEIFVLIGLSKVISSRAREKNYSAAPWVALLVASWIVGELSGLFLAAVATGGTSTVPIVAGALLGALVGAVFSFSVVAALPVRAPEEQGPVAEPT